MRIIVLFQFNHENSPTAVTGVEGNVVDILLPGVGDTIKHTDDAGRPFEGRVTERMFAYGIPAGIGVDGTVAVTLCLDRTVVQ